jgi:TPR repeat protein
LPCDCRKEYKGSSSENSFVSINVRCWPAGIFSWRLRFENYGRSLNWLIGLVIRVRREAMRTLALIGAGAVLLGGWFALTPAAAQTKDAAAFDRHLRALADKGDADAQYKLGTAYDEGLGVSKDYTEAFKWFRLAAEQGHAHSQFRVGDMYMSGQGVAKNEDEAMKWFRKAAEQGLANAQGMIGIMYAKGQAVPVDYVLAYMWLYLAAEGNPGAAQFRDAVGQRMTATQIAEAQKRAREWKTSKGR